MTSTVSATAARRTEAWVVGGLIPGFMWKSELLWLFDHHREIGSRVHVEVGSYCGRSLFATAAGMPPGSRLIAVDALTGSPWLDADWVRTVLHATIKRAAKFGVRIEHWEMGSLAAMRRARSEGLLVDSVFIDADHDLDPVQADIEGWSALLAPNGRMSGHDYWPKDAGVMEAVNATVPEFGVVPGTRIWVRR